jgi:hypothetical protein
MSEKVNKIKFQLKFSTIHKRSSPAGDYNYGFMLDSVPDKVVNELDEIYKDIVDNMSEKLTYNHFLAGEIEHEFEADFGKEFRKYIIDLARHYEVKSDSFIKKSIHALPLISLNQAFDGEGINYQTKEQKEDSLVYFKNHDIPELDLSSGWINLQQKTEYNPMHNHSGLLSFVVWHKIPFLKEKEDLVGGSKNKAVNQERTNGTFNFVHHDGEKVNCVSLGVDNRWENTIAIFPSDLMHMVYPFYTSDEYRVTFSGNLFIKNEQSILKFQNTGFKI